MSAIKTGLGTTVRFLNQPAIKEGIKNFAGAAAFTFGIVEAYDIYQICQGREVSTEADTNTPKWVQVASKVALICAKISILLSAVVSRPGVFIIAAILGSVFSTGQLEHVFGPNAVFAVNPWHPRHIVTIAAVILALPSVIVWACTQTCPKGEDAKTQSMALFNTVLSRPAQHVGNQLCRGIVG